MSRSYELRKRAERQEQTRRRIVEAAVALHTEIGPARTTVSAVAERAGVERHTYYRHFPDERSLTLACSGLFFELNPFPDPASWQSVADPQARLKRALGEVYVYYGTHESLLANVNRDAMVHAPTAEASAIRMGPIMAAARATLAVGLAAGQDRRRALAALDLALAFDTWKTLVKTNGLRRREAVSLMARMVMCAARGQPGR